MLSDCQHLGPNTGIRKESCSLKLHYQSLSRARTPPSALRFVLPRRMHWSVLHKWADRTPRSEYHYW